MKPSVKLPVKLLIKIVVLGLVSYLLSACSSIPGSDHILGPELTRDDWDKPSEVYNDLISLPSTRGKIVASVYNFRDLTGQYKPSPSSSFSTAVSQGSASMLVKAIKDSQWFAPLEREGLQDLLTERKIIRAAIKNSKSPQDVPPLLGANILFEGGIIAYETNMKTGGAGAKYFGVGISEQYRVDQVTVNLRVVDVNSGRVINSVNVSRSILSRQVQTGAFRFVRFKRLLEIEAGYTRNEPVQLCLTEAIQEAVLRVIVDGVADRSWSLANIADLNNPIIEKYGDSLKLAKLIPKTIPKQVQKQATATQRDGISKPAVIVKNTKSDSISSGKSSLKVPAAAANNNNNIGVANSAIFSSNRVTEISRDSTKKITPVINAKSQVDESNMLEHSVFEMPDGVWGIRLMSSYSAMDVLNYVREKKLRRDMIEYIHLEAQGKDSFAIIYGKFHDKTRALKAIESLPPKLRIYEPAMRSLVKA
ncbi:MAG: curli production assembly/transport component CsgG [Flavobacteriales bacterium]|jgi:curli production assembly/transport component CsgG